MPVAWILCRLQTLNAPSERTHSAAHEILIPAN
jgi:hypothetical protein